jgi:hypothetical protein
MAVPHEIKCIRKTDRQNPYECIWRLGGVDSNGIRWTIDQQDAIIGIEQGKWSFYVKQDGAVVNVVIAVSSCGHKYLKTIADGEQPNNLLSLPECP